MTVRFKVVGLKEVVKNLKLKEHQLGANLNRGLQRAGSLVRAESLKLTPKDSGALKESVYGGVSYPIKYDAGRPYAEVGYTAPYAAQVHEETGKLKGQRRRKTGSTGNYWDTGGEPKFLEKALRRNARKIRNVIKKSVKL